MQVSSDEASWIGSLMPLAGLLGSLAGGPMLEELGRRTTIALMSRVFFSAFAL